MQFYRFKSLRFVRILLVIITFRVVRGCKVGNVVLVASADGPQTDKRLVVVFDSGNTLFEIQLQVFVRATHFLI